MTEFYSVTFKKLGKSNKQTRILEVNGIKMDRKTDSWHHIFFIILCAHHGLFQTWSIPFGWSKNVEFQISSILVIFDFIVNESNTN